MKTKGADQLQPAQLAYTADLWVFCIFKKVDFLMTLLELCHLAHGIMTSFGVNDIMMPPGT